jgi:hypothetical protein
MLTSQQQQMVQNSQLLTQPSQSFSYSTAPPSQHIISSIIPNETIKQAIPPPPPPPPSSSSLPTTSTTTENIENSHISISPSPTPLSVSHINETVQPSTASDTQPEVRSKKRIKEKKSVFKIF